MIKKAIVLAAGFGTRLKPLTYSTPKSMLPVWGVPMLARIVAFLRERGITDIVVNAHFQHEQIEAWCKANDCRVSYEPTILGNGGALNPLRDWIGSDPFYLVNSDIVMENVPDLERAFAAAGPDAIGVALVSSQGPRSIEVEPKSGFVTNWRSDEAGDAGNYTYCGCTVLKPEILKYVKPEGFSSIIVAYEKAMMTDGKFIRIVTSDDLLWEDAGTIQNYVELNTDGKENALADLPQLQAVGATGVEFLFARGSERVFFRCDRGIAIVYDDETRRENGLYAGHARWLKSKGIPVPEVLAERIDLKTVLLSYAGAEHKMTLDEYADAVRVLARFHKLANEKDLPKLLPGFDLDSWKWEHDLFATQCLGRYFMHPMPDDVRAELEKVAAILVNEPTALVHRDFQSTNILWKNGKLSFIDFQGMRLGPGLYDLASLLYDPYVEMKESTRHALAALYAKEMGRDDVEKILPLAAVQRLVQCLGAYGRLISVGQPQFARYIVPALQHLLEAADEANLDAVGALAEDLIADAGKRR